MNTNAIAKHYDQLSHDERFALLVQAASRGDRGECARLRASGPRLPAVLDVAAVARSNAFHQLANAHRQRVLELAGFLLLAGLVATGKPGDALARAMVEYYGFRFRSNETAWGMFCDRHHLAADFWDESQHGGALLWMARDAIAPAPVLTEADVMALCERAGVEPADLTSAEAVAADLDESFRSLVAANTPAWVS